MLSTLTIRNIAIASRVDLELDPGLTVITGETGAGKSILVDALGLVMGDRADAGLVRAGAERAEVTAVFDTSGLPDVQAWLAEQELDDDEGSCVVRRTVSANGGSRAFINGSPVNLRLLRELGTWLADLHSQHEHQSLARPEVHRQLLDDYGGLQAEVGAVADAYHRWRGLRDEHERLSREAEERDARRELLSYQVQELDDLGLTADEPAELEREHQRLAHAGQLLEHTQGALTRLYDAETGAALPQIEQALTTLESMTALDEALQRCTDCLNEAAIQAREAVGELRDYLDRIELDPERLQTVESRLDRIQTLARKHHVEPAELPRLAEALRAELESLSASGERLTNLTPAIEAAAAEYREAATRLSEGRAATAERLAQAITERLQRLGMADAAFLVDLSPRPDDETTFSPTGLEDVTFQIRTNPGQPAQPLGKIASGGELSRISLAVQVVTADANRIPTLVFDEVDAGVGGGVAEIVGQELRKLGSDRQVLCITHLPQVASQGQSHWVVSKDTEAGEVETRLEPLSSATRHEEIARMLGGVEITEQTLAHAREMIERAHAGSPAR